MDWWLCRLQIKIKLKPMSEILSLAPQNVWKHFYALTQVPRPSGHLAKVQSFLLEFGKQAGVEAFPDSAWVNRSLPFRGAVFRFSATFIVLPGASPGPPAGR